MKKVVRLNESDIVRLVKKVIIENKKMLKEDADIQGHKWSVSNDGKLLFNGMKFNIKVDATKLGVSVYNGPIVLKNMWDSGNDVAMVDNTGKQFTVPKNVLYNVAETIKKGGNYYGKDYADGKVKIGGIEASGAVKFQVTQA
jgi:hypothetical protein